MEMNSNGEGTKKFPVCNRMSQCNTVYFRMGSVPV